MKNMFQLLIKSIFTFPVMVMEVTEPMITVILHMSFIRMKQFTVDIFFINNNAL